MPRKFLAILLVLALGVSLYGCVTDSGYYDPYRSAGAGALGGAATGAAIGAIIGAATGSAATGAWIGAAAGGVLGGVGGALYAAHRNSEIRSSQAAAQAYNYNPSQGPIVNIEQTDANPGVVGPGQRVQLGMTYTVLTPGNAPTTLNLVREVRLGGETLGPPYSTMVTNINGTYTDSVQYELPRNATPGTYVVISRVSSPTGFTERQSFFTVR